MHTSFHLVCLNSYNTHTHTRVHKPAKAHTITQCMHTLHAQMHTNIHSPTLTQTHKHTNMHTHAHTHLCTHVLTHTKHTDMAYVMIHTRTHTCKHNSKVMVVNAPNVQNQYPSLRVDLGGPRQLEIMFIFN